ncbi:MAG: zinc ribbon domain-containing protein [Treponema sp.]|jgi:RNA polymerase subunit RPABC4/transcription elongation factor Spt4|nr:zinc ribbon domain-containing protein [Treponema sp.]
MGQPHFICDNCIKEVPQDAEVCPHCGKSFASVKCPACGFVGEAKQFYEGCPICGYLSLPPSEKPPAKAVPTNKKREPSDTHALMHKRLSFRETVGAVRAILIAIIAKSQTMGLPLWVYVVTILAFISMCVALFSIE